MSELKKLTDLTNNGLRLIQYGDSGVGKSVRASEATRWGIVEFHDFDDKIGNLLEVLKKHYPDRIDKIQVFSYAGLADDQKIKAFMDRIAELRSGKDPKVATLVIDSYTRFEDLYFDHLMNAFKPVGGASFGSPRVNVQTAGGMLLMPGTNDSTMLARAVKKLLKSLKELKINIICNAHVKEYTETKTAVQDQGTIAAYGQTRGFLPTEFHETHRLFTDQLGKRKVQVRADSYYVANSALADIPQTGFLFDTSLALFDDRAFKKLDKLSQDS